MTANDYPKPIEKILSFEWQTERVSTRPDIDEFDLKSRTHERVHLLVTIKKEDKKFSSFYSFGVEKKHPELNYANIAFKPPLDKISFLECLQGDCALTAETLEEYFEEFGYPTNKKEFLDGSRVVEACKKTRRELKALLGTELYNSFIALTGEDFEQAHEARKEEIKRLRR